MSSRILGLCVALGLFLLLSMPAYGCLCAPPFDSPRAESQREFNEASVVFEGELISKEIKKGSLWSPQALSYSTFGDEYLESTLRVLRTYKGTTAQAVIKIDTIYSGGCGGRFQSKQKYLVYAFRDDKTQQLWISTCTRTTVIENAGADLRFLRGQPAAKDDLIEAYRRQLPNREHQPKKQ